MNKNFKFIILIILPACLVFLSIFLRNSKGPFFLNIHYDPGYAYLINALNFSQLNGYGSEFIDHPGIPLQVFGGFVIRVFHFIQNGNSDIANDLLTNPEKYMNLINNSLIFLNSIVLLIFGWFIYKMFNNVVIAFFFQLTPFSSFNTFYEVSDVSAESFLLMFYILIILISLKYFNKVKKNVPVNDLLYLTGFSIVSAIGVATKLNFTPMMLIPFLLFKKFSYKISYLISSFILFLIFISPGFRDLSFFLNWFKKIVSNNGFYSHADSSINSSPDFLLNLRNIFYEDIFFAIVFFFLLILLISKITGCLLKSSFKIFSLREFYKNNNLLIAVFLIMNFEFLFLLKNFSHHYIFPSLVLSMTALYLSIQLVYADLPESFKNIKLQSVYLFIIILIFSFQFFNYKAHFEKYSFERDEAVKLNEFANGISADALTISSYGSSNKEYALNYSNYWAGSQIKRYGQMLYTLYPDQLFYEYWTKKIFAFSESADIKKILYSKKKIIYRTNNTNSINEVIKDLENNYSLIIDEYTKKYENSTGEMVYEIIVSKK